MKIIDTKGQKCPKPIVETKKALKESGIGETFSVLSDSKTSVSNISRYLTDNGIKFSISEENGIWTFLVTNETGTGETGPVEEICEVTSKDKVTADFVVAITSEIMGYGDDNLGKKLMRSLFVSLTCLDELPGVIVFYNSGVRLAEKNSEVIDLIRELENKGVEIILCGTCVDHFGIGDNIGAGKTGDMYLITQKLLSAERIIRP